MGIIILPFLLGTLIVSVYAIRKVMLLRNAGEITSTELMWGLLLSTGLFIAISISYMLEGSVWALSSAFRIPFFMIFLPFGLHLVTMESSNRKLKYTSKILLVSICCSAILGMLFYKIVFNLPDYLGVETHH